ncbi:MAG: lysophospholipid acyltransferase family protein [Candidatus Krumholzibacteria bacterium]|nr:lysophospholipid acyltransferase family protein [Candidatus Krumholzibacteria bacterium]
MIAALANATPVTVRGGIVSVCACFGYVLSREKRRNVAENIAAAGLEATPGRVFGIFKLHATNVIEMFASSAWENDTILGWCELEGRVELERALAGGKGVILVSVHTGSWELGARCLQALGYSLHVVAGVQMNRLLTGAVREAKEERGIEVISPDDSYRKLLKALASNGVVILLVDGNIYTGGVELPFFGRTTRLPDGPARLSRTSGAPILGGYCRRMGNKEHKLHVEHIMDAREIESLPEREALARIYGAVERFIGQNADQWCMFRRLWGA